MDAVTRGNHIRRHRKKSGLTLQELGRILGYADEGAVLRHEGSKTIPPLLTAIAYQAIFHVPISELFPGLQATVEEAVKRRLSEFEKELQGASAKSKRIRLIVQKLAWLDERRALLED